ncbi:STAS/SEC14 domain-containing protein [Pradoshia sp.]
MLEIIPSRDRMTVAVQFSGKATQTDADKLERYVAEHYGNNQKFNILAIIKDVDGTNLMGMVNGLKFDAKRMNQFNKIATVSNLPWVQSMASLGNMMPALEVKAFSEQDLEKAWAWVITSGNKAM